MPSQSKIIFLLVTCILMLSYSNNPPTGKTNAPGEGFCGECHSRININLRGSITLNLPSNIVKDSTYDISVSISKISTSIMRGGFELVALKTDINDPSGYSNAGEFIIEPGTSVSVRPENPLDDRQYLAHAPAQNFGTDTVVTYTAKWRASFISPENQDVTFYAAGMLANGNNDNTGDLPLLTSSKVTVLPVKITKLSCGSTNQNNHLSWQMEGLENIKSIFLESSKDGRNWYSFKQIDFSVFQKSFETQLPKFTQAKFYRIKTESFEGEAEFSEISVCDSNGSLFYPSLFSDQIFADVDLSELPIAAYTSDGKTLPITKNIGSIQIVSDYKGVIILQYGGQTSRFIKF